jgi:hypothetical protein
MLVHAKTKLVRAWAKLVRARTKLELMRTRLELAKLNFILARINSILALINSSNALKDSLSAPVKVNSVAASLCLPSIWPFVAGVNRLCASGLFVYGAVVGVRCAARA